MKIEHLLRKGYFPKELPPPFTTKYFSKNFQSIDDSWDKIKSRINRENKELYKQKYKEKFKSSRCVTFSLPKKNFSRRNLEIPNPFHHSILCKSICDNWKAIDDFCQESKISLSMPVINTSKGRAVKTLKTFSGFKRECLIDSFDKLYELKTDISWFYPTLYTHTIPWALHGKKTAKKDRSDNLFGNILDKNISNCKHGQTPDTSHIIAEIVTCGIDQLLIEKLNLIRGYRFYDDLYLYFSSKEGAEKGLRHIQYILNDFQLSINEEKTSITIFPTTFDENWAIQISSFEFRNNIEKDETYRVKEQKTDIERYFKLAFYLKNKYPGDSVLSYAIERFKSVPIMDENWELFESLILKSALLNPLLLQQITPLLVAYIELIDKNKIGRIIEEILKIHAFLGHSHEISWALWLAKTFDIKIESSLAKDIFGSYDVISILIALDLIDEGLIDSSMDLSSIIEDLTEDLTEDSLFEEKWLLTYESIIQNWLVPINSNPLETNEYFNILREHEIKFYDKTIKEKPLRIKGLKEIEKVEEPEEVEEITYHEEPYYHGYY
jgi:hypothetical protein